MKKIISEAPNLTALQKLFNRQDEDLKVDDYSIHNKMDKLLELKNLNLKHFVFLDTIFQKASLKKSLKATNVVDLWFTACPPCLKDQTKMVDILPQLNTTHFALIGLSIDQDYDKWRQYLVMKKLLWIQWIQDRDAVNPLSDYIPGYPFYLIVDKSGNIIDYFQQYEQIFQYLKQSGYLVNK